MGVCILSRFSRVQLCDPMDGSPWLFCPWDSPGKNTGVGYHALFWGISPTKGLKPHLFTSPTLAGRFFTTSTTWEALYILYNLLGGFLGDSVVKNPHASAREGGSIRKIPWKRKWKPTSVFLPGESDGQRNLVGNSPWGRKRVRCDLVTKQQQVF